MALCPSARGEGNEGAAWEDFGLLPLEACLTIRRVLREQGLFH